MENAEELIEELYAIIHSYTIFFLIFDVLFFASIVLVIFLAIKYLKSDQKLRTSDKYLRYTIQGQEEERARIARELHDTVAQDLRYCRSLSLKLSDQDLQSDISKILDKSISEVRSMSYNLAPPDITKNDLCANVINLCNTFEEFSDIEIRLTIPENTDTSFLTKEENLNLYRIIQEALNNILKHAQADEVTVLLQKQKHLKN
ncbi:sensor histidine kinase [Treponema sp.]|uniref:sensor histidine kinase n=1 Tax=Treponema sp. TaxID=166 RepID=UPI00388D6726